MPGKNNLGQAFAENLFQFARQRRPVDGGSLFRRHALHCAALNEKPLDPVQRRELAVPRLKRAHFLGVAEEFADEVFQMRRQLDQQIGFRLGFERVGILARGGETPGQGGVARLHMIEEGGVEPHQSVAPIQIRESQSVFQPEFRHRNSVSAERTVDITPIFLWKWTDSTSGRRCFLRERAADLNSPARCRPCAGRSRR